MGKVERFLRRRATAGADLLAAAEIRVSRDDDLAEQAAVVQRYYVAEQDRTWVEPFMLVAFAAKQISNFRGDDAVAVWLMATGQGVGPGYQLVDELPDAGGIYEVQVYRHDDELPFVQTPVTGGSRGYRDVEAGGAIRALFNGLRRNGPDSARRAQEAMEQLRLLGADFARRPSAAEAMPLAHRIVVQVTRSRHVG